MLKVVCAISMALFVGGCPHQGHFSSTNSSPSYSASAEEVMELDLYWKLSKNGRAFVYNDNTKELWACKRLTTEYDPTFDNDDLYLLLMAEFSKTGCPSQITEETSHESGRAGFYSWSIQSKWRHSKTSAFMRAGSSRTLLYDNKFCYGISGIKIDACLEPAGGRSEERSENDSSAEPPPLL